MRSARLLTVFLVLRQHGISDYDICFFGSTGDSRPRLGTIYFQYDTHRVYRAGRGDYTIIV